tara:strand:+ start:193 stop:333 length:141 start_codon:yes stop_codon:yes gene_type:complete
MSEFEKHYRIAKKKHSSREASVADENFEGPKMDNEPMPRKREAPIG